MADNIGQRRIETRGLFTRPLDAEHLQQEFVAARLSTHKISSQPPHQFSEFPMQTVRSQQAPEGQGGYSCQTYYQSPHQILQTEPPGDEQFIPLFNGVPEHSGRDAAGGNSSDPSSARKLHKADRERLRRDQLNEHFAKLAAVLDPVRPKNDKGSILADSILMLSEVRSEIARMKSDHLALVDESRDLTQENVELVEEKESLETIREGLQNQLQQGKRQQNMPALPGWMTMDPSGLMSAPQFPKHMPVPPPRTSKDSFQPPTTIAQIQKASVSPSPILSIAPPGNFIQSAFQTYASFGSGLEAPPYFSPSHFPPHAAQHPHVERPFARYPVPVHPTPVYAAQMQKHSQVTPSELPMVETDLQLQTPSLPSLTGQLQDQGLAIFERWTTRVQGAASQETDSIMNDDIGAAEGDQLIPQLSLAA